MSSARTNEGAAAANAMASAVLISRLCILGMVLSRSA
jgi:hypothetical protein